MSEVKVAVFNPLNKEPSLLPVIYGFKNGGSHGMLEGVLLAEDGTELGSHLCSNEGFMVSDLGIVKGSRDDRHKTFQKHYPDGYVMEFVWSANISEHVKLNAAIDLANAVEVV